jgi:hypothetical protein
MAAARQVRVQRFAANVLPVIREMQGARHKSFNAIVDLPRLPSRCERARGPLNHSGLRNGYLLGVRRSSNHTSDWVVIQSVAEE